MRSAGRTFATSSSVTALCVAASLFAGCVGEGDQVIVQDPFPASGLPLRDHPGKPLDLGLFERLLLAPSPPSALGTAQGRLVVGASDGAWLSHPELVSGLVPFPLRRDADEPEATGAVHALAQRPTGGVLLSAQAGLFHDAEDGLYYSPLSRGLPGPVAQVDACAGADGEEVLWLLPEDEADLLWRVAEGQLWPVRLSNLDEKVERVVGLDREGALLSVGGALYALDLQKKSLRLLLRDVGTLHGVTRGAEGTLFFATDAGLLERTPDGTFLRHTLAAEGDAPLPARAVFGAEEGVLVATDTSLVQLRASGPVQIAQQESRAHAVAQDASGDAFVADEGGLWRHLTGAPVSFETQVRPFLQAHCTTCHRAGDGAPVLDFEDYEVARSLAERIRIRLEAEEVSPMPPQSVEILSRADYAVVLRWIAGGMKP